MDATDLYRGPLEEFVARRNALVRELRSSDPDAAGAAAKLRKPSVAVWAIDQLATDDPEVVVELLAAGADAREAQHAAATQDDSRDDLLRATGRLRDAVEAVARAAIGVLESTGHAGGDETGRRIRATLQAAATGRAADRLALWRGTLDRDLAPSGFGAVDAPEPDGAQLAAVLAPLRRPASAKPRREAQGRRQPSPEARERQEAERATATEESAAERARALATTKRLAAQRLADAARAADDEASAAEQAADEAERAARAARASLGR